MQRWRSIYLPRQVSAPPGTHTPECWTLLQPALGHALIGTFVPSMAAVTAASIKKSTINPGDVSIKVPQAQRFVDVFF